MRKLTVLFLCAALILGLGLRVSGEMETVTVSNAQELMALAESCRLDSYSQGLTVSLEADIDLSGTDFQGIPIFCGTFQGNGHTVSGFNLNTYGSYLGFFRYLTESAVVEQLHISGSVTPEGSREYIGGMVGSNAGVIRNCSFSGRLSGSSYTGGIAGINQVSGLIENCSANGNISGLHFAGGIVGSNHGVIRDCENQAAVNTTPQENSVDITDMTLETITGTESASTVTDVGGIAGTSSGTVRQCVNRGSVGYRQMGYNIGGILGSQTGYTVDCENHGEVAGRKDVGGIAGHLEPVMLVDFETDTLQQLRIQLETLSVLTDRAVGNVNNNTAAIRALLRTMEDHAAQAQDAIDILTQPENLEDPEAYWAALQTLGSSLTGMETTLRQLGRAAEDTAYELEADLQAVADQMDAISATLQGGEENLGGSLTDGSDGDTAEDLTSKIEGCVNKAPVQADWNAGGILGAMALENDLDPEEDVFIAGSGSLNMAGTLRSVVLGCANEGKITALKQNAGGIAGWQSMGLVKQCSGTGAVRGGSYTGGIAGQSLGYIRACYAKCSVSGEDHVGGIAGSGTVVTDCRSMAAVSGLQMVGAVLGISEENHTDQEIPISANYYACPDRDPGGIDGISYQGVAQMLALESFLALETMPELFETVCVTFVFADGTQQTLSLPVGDPLTKENIPVLPVIDGCEGVWDGLAEDGLEQVLQDMTFTAAYNSRETVIPGDRTVEGKPQLLVQGDFSPNTTVSMTAVEEVTGLAGSLLQAWRLEFSQPGTVTGGRYLMEEGWNADQLAVYVRTGESWKQVSHRVNGSYLVFAMDTAADAFAIAEQEAASFPWLWLTVGIIAVAAVTVTVIRIRKKKR